MISLERVTCSADLLDIFTNAVNILDAFIKISTIPQLFNSLIQHLWMRYINTLMALLSAVHLNPDLIYLLF